MNKKAEAALFILGAVAVIAIIGLVAVSLKSSVTGAAVANGCTKIQSETIYATDGELIETGYDSWGYNYQAHMFNGKYCDQFREVLPPGWEDCYDLYGTIDLSMKWNDAWISNTDCDGDGTLDRHYGFASYIGSGAWETNHMKDSYQYNGKTCRWEWFTKIVAKPLADYDCAAHGGYEIWNDFCVIQSVYNDPCGGFHGKELLADKVGLGQYKP